jgi:hypothetical protein
VATSLPDDAYRVCNRVEDRMGSLLAQRRVRLVVCLRDYVVIGFCRETAQELNFLSFAAPFILINSDVGDAGGS